MLLLDDDEVLSEEPDTAEASLATKAGAEGIRTVDARKLSTRVRHLVS